MRKAIFLDKDGTLIHNFHYNIETDLVVFTKGAAEGLKKFATAGYALVIISNQQGVALKYFTEEDLLPVKDKLQDMFHAAGVILDGFYYCPHHTIDNCICRKPKPGMIVKAAFDLGIDLNHSWMIGDTLSDIEAGKRAGCRTLLFDKGYENQWEFEARNRPEFTVKSLNQAANYVLFRSKPELIKDPFQWNEPTMRT